MWYGEDMNEVIRACAILQNMITEVRDSDGRMGLQNIVSIKLGAQVALIRTLHVSSDPFDAAEFYKEQTMSSMISETMNCSRTP